ncbi:helix-turn-helix transcriptional regulator [Trinickia violacea]|uniref:Helix-turn-helix transcriptional regulator n=1 Tax=Trinickia violacea TaxID=2571746 RepID=A0A4P8IN39_9BURK|nr:helix-turn-helix transcriptional regulator [Trinickia violacea]
MLLRKAFGLSVSSERKARNLTQAELAELANVHLSALSALERGLRPANMDTMETVSKALGVPLSILFRRAEDLLETNPSR